MCVWIYFAPEKAQMSDWADSNNEKKWVPGHHHVNGQKNNSPFDGTGIRCDNSRTPKRNDPQHDEIVLGIMKLDVIKISKNGC